MSITKGPALRVRARGPLACFTRPELKVERFSYPVMTPSAARGLLYGGVLGLPIAFLIGRDGRIYSKHIGATNISVFEREITTLMQAK